MRCRQGQTDRRRQDTVANAYHQIASALHLLAVLRVIDVPPENKDDWQKNFYSLDRDSVKGASSRFGGLEGRNLVTTFDYAADQRVAKSRMGRRKRPPGPTARQAWAVVGEISGGYAVLVEADHQAGRFVRLASGP